MDDSVDNDEPMEEGAFEKMNSTASTEEADEAIEDDSELKDAEDSSNVTFNPPVYIQRYGRVRETLSELLKGPRYKDMSPGKTVMEVGCAEFGMMVHFKSLLDIGKIIFLDLDEQLMKDKLHVLKPLPAEYLSRTTRPKTLEVEAYAGCVTKVDADLRQQNPDIWAIVGIELIEHLHADVLRGFEETVFGVYSPHLVVVTTPNSDFNEVFKLPPNKFRHWDHKFEWSRAEFKVWCEKIVSEFTDYTFRIEGICQGTEETLHLGCVSQMAVFEKKLKTEVISKNQSAFEWRIQNGCYKLLHTVTYPNYVETRSKEEIIKSEIEYFFATFMFSKSMLDDYYEKDIKDVTIPLRRITVLGNIADACEGDITLVKDVLAKLGYKIEGDHDEAKITINVEEYVTANMIESDDELDEDQELCLDLNDLTVNRIFPADEESWE